MKTVLMLICVALIASGMAEAQTAEAGKQADKSDVASNKAAASAELEEAARLNQTVVKLFGEGKYEEALPVAKRVLEIREKALGGDHILVASALNNLGAIYTEEKKYGDASPIFERALGIARKSGGTADALTADISGQLGLIRLREKKYEEAEMLFGQSLELKEKLNGTEHPNVVPALFNLADLYFLKNDFNRAETYLLRAVEIIDAQPPKRDPPTLQRLKSYICPLYSAGKRETGGKVYGQISRLENPEETAEFEKRTKSGGKSVVMAGVLEGRVLSKPQPEYPSAAKRARVMGVVVVRLKVDETGKVTEAEAICGPPLLRDAAVQAARQARFTQTLLSGMPVKVSGVITYNFVLIP